MEITKRSEAKSGGLKRYFTGKPCKHGHISERTVSNGSCCDCSRIKDESSRSSRSEYFREKRKEQYSKNRDEEIRKAKEYREANRDKVNESARRYREANRDEVNKKARDYREKNREKMKSLQLAWRKSNPDNANVRRPLYRLIESVNLKRHEEAIGYTRDDLVEHIESLFADGMDWENHGEWHIDHIRSVASFLKEGINDPKIINALSNLQPLWAEDNIRKGSTHQE